jgi:hypothetical protein
MATRRGFIATLGAFIGAPMVPTKEVKTWYITGGHRSTQTDCDVEPIITKGEDRIDAINNSGITIWSEEEWASNSNDVVFRESCRQIKANKKY